MTVFTSNGDGTLKALSTRVDIGDGFQNSLKDHLTQICDGEAEKNILNKFNDSLSDRQYKKIYTVEEKENEKEDRQERSVESIKEEVKRRAKDVESSDKRTEIKSNETEHAK